MNNPLLTGSIKNTRKAAVRFNPTPPAFTDKSTTVQDPAWLLWKQQIASILFFCATDPSKRVKANPDSLKRK